MMCFLLLILNALAGEKGKEGREEGERGRDNILCPSNVTKCLKSHPQILKLRHRHLKGFKHGHRCSEQPR